MTAKLFLGHRLRRLRRDRDLSQTDMAQSLGISPSYLNHLERNQRPVTAGLLLKLAELYDVDVRAFAAGGGAHTGPDALSEIFADRILERPRGAALRTGRDRQQCPVDRRCDRAALHRGQGGRAASGPCREWRCARACHARELGARLHPATPQPLSRARAGRGDAWRRAQRSLVDGRADAPAAEGRVGNQRLRGPAGGARQREPALRSGPAFLPDVGRAKVREPHVRAGLSAFAGRVRRGDRPHGQGCGPAGRRHSPAAPHEPRQLCGGGDHDALRALPGERRILSLLDRPAVRRIWRQRRTGRASLHHT